MPTIWYNARVMRVEDATPRVRRFWLSVVSKSPFTFQAGQFVTFDLPVGEKRLNRWKSYSIASAPSADNIIELCIVRMQGGLASNYLFDEVAPGHILKFKGPEGTFVLPGEMTQDLVLVCTGTGIAPFRSMLLDLHAQGWTDRNIHLIFGSRTREDLLYMEDWEALQKAHPHFKFTAALSRIEDNPAEDWVVKGYVHKVYEKAFTHPQKDCKFMLCGWTNMIDEAVVHLLTRLGYNRDQIIYELYG